MWPFNRKPTNRRNRREHLLDVRLRSDRLRTSRARFIAGSVAVLLGAGVVVLGVLQGSRWALDEFVYRNPSFAITEIDAQTDGIIQPEQIRRWAGVKLNDNLFALDLLQVKRDLELVPLIQSAAVERVLPHTLKLRVVEREPVAQVLVPRPRTGGGFEQLTFQLDTAGYVMMPLDRRLTTDPTSQYAESLPVLTGIDGTLMQPGRRLESAQVRAALRLITEFDRSPMAGLVDVKRIDVATPEILRLTTGQGSEICFSTSQIDVQLRRWRIVRDAGLLQQPRPLAIASLDLSVTNNNPAQMVEASTVPSMGTKAARPARTRRKNV